ncbi:MAG: alpha/beta hydrolase [Acidimicrobiales bacterium]
MASEQFVAFQQKKAANPVPPPAKDIVELRARIDGFMGQLALAEGTSAVEVDANGVPAFLQTRAGGDDDPLVIYFHGGGYRIASALAYRAYCSNFAARAGVRVLNVDYRLAPENPFPAAVEDAISAYRWALANGTPASRIVIAGDSAGGGLTAAALLAIRDRGLDTPAGAICLSPWVDLTNTNETYTTRSSADKMFSLASATEASGLYLQGQDPKLPLVSPVFADLAGLPPLLILVGDAEVLLDDSRALAARASDAGVANELFIYPDMPHVWMTDYPAFPEAAQAFDQMAAFVARVTR